jgi:hypothetical protein
VLGYDCFVLRDWISQTRPSPNKGENPERTRMTMTKERRQAHLDAIAAIPDDAIDTSDIPELTEEEFNRGVRGMLYRKPNRASGEERKAKSE